MNHGTAPNGHWGDDTTFNGKGRGGEFLDFGKHSFTNTLCKKIPNAVFLVIC